MKPTHAIRSFLLGSSIATLLTAPAAFAGNTWDGGAGTGNTLTAANWNVDGVPTSSTSLILTFAGTTQNNITWNGINTNTVNLRGFTFNNTAGAFIFNNGTFNLVQFVGGSATTALLNSSSNLQTLNIESHVFYTGTKTFDAGAQGLALNNIVFRGDTMTTGQVNTLNLIGSGNSTTTNISRLGGFAGTATTALVKDGTGKWTVTGNVTDIGPTTITQGTLEYQGDIASSTIANNAAMILNNANATSFSYANNITGTGTVTKSGLGTYTLSGAGGYSGATTVTQGKLTISAGNINGTSGISIGSGEFNYNSSTALTKAVSFSGTGGTLSGNNSTINPAVNVTTGNTLAIGNSNVGVMNFAGNLTLGGTYLFELNNTDNTADLGDVAGTLTLGGILDLVQLGAYTAGDKFTLLAYDGALSGTFTGILDDTNFTDAGGMWTMNYNDTTAGLNGGVSASNTYVTVTAIPEPRAALLGGLGMLALLRRRRN